MSFALKYRKKGGSTLRSPCSFLPTSDLAFSLSRVWGGGGVRPVILENGFVEEGELCSENVLRDSFTVAVYHLLQLKSCYNNIFLPSKSFCSHSLWSLLILNNTAWHTIPFLDVLFISSTLPALQTPFQV